MTTYGICLHIPIFSRDSDGNYRLHRHDGRTVEVAGTKAEAIREACRLLDAAANPPATITGSQTASATVTRLVGSHFGGDAVYVARPMQRAIDETGTAEAVNVAADVAPHPMMSAR